VLALQHHHTQSNTAINKNSAIVRRLRRDEGVNVESPGVRGNVDHPRTDRFNLDDACLFTSQTEEELEAIPGGLMRGR
jgi:hypothetical protein